MVSYVDRFSVSLVIYNPVELMKVRAQTNRVENIVYRQVARVIYRQEGIGGFYRGFGALWWRDVPGWAVYFWAYDFLKRVSGLDEARKNGTEYTKLNFAIKLWAAGVAGQISWLVCYPFDLIKTRIQCTTSRKMTIREVCRQMYVNEGVGSFFKGLSVCLGRSFYVNAVTLPCFDYLNEIYCSRISDD